MKTVVWLDTAVAGLEKHRNMSKRIVDKVDAYAANPASLANQVTELRSSRAKRLRVGDFRVIFEESGAEIVVTDIGPRGSVYR